MEEPTPLLSASDSDLDRPQRHTCQHGLIGASRAVAAASTLSAFVGILILSRGQLGHFPSSSIAITKVTDSEAVIAEYGNAQCSPPQKGMNNGGVNLKEDAVKTDSASSCCDACLAAHGCTGYTYVQASGECWLKSTVSTLSPDQYATSASVVQVAVEVSSAPALENSAAQVAQSSSSNHHRPLAGFVAGSSSSLSIHPRQSQVADISAGGVPDPSIEPVPEVVITPTPTEARATVPPLLADLPAIVPVAPTGQSNLPGVQAVPQQLPSCSPPQRGMNNGGTNLHTSAVVASSAEDCCSACLREPQCAGYTLVEAKRECWLKASVEPPTPDQYATSAVVDAPAAQISPAMPLLGGGSPVTTLTSGMRQPLAPVLLGPGAEPIGWMQAGPSKGHVMLAGAQSAKLLGKTLRMNVDVHQVGCGCVTGVYLVERGDGSACDGSGTFAGRCGEIDLFEGNQFAWHSTLHDPMDHAGVAGGFGGLQQPDMMFGRGPRDMSGDEYGPGGSIIDTARPFHAAVSFPEGPDGSLIDMVVMLYQDGNTKAIEFRVNKKREDRNRSPSLTCADANCKDCFSKPGCVYQQPALQSFGSWLSSGMTPLSTYWGGPTNTWIDAVMDGEHGGCKLGQHGTSGTENYGGYLGGGGCYGAGYTIDGFTVEDISAPAIPWDEFLQHMDANPIINH